MNLKDFAISATKLTFGHIDGEGMTKLESEDIAGKEVTIIDYDFAHDPKKNEDYAVAIFKEYDNAFYFGGKCLTDLCQKISNEHGMYDALCKDGLKVKFVMTKPKNKDGNKYYKVEIV